MRKINKQNLFKLLDKGCTREEILKEMNISNGTYYNYLKQYNTLKVSKPQKINYDKYVDAIQFIKEKQIHPSKQTLAQLLGVSKPTLIKFEKDNIQPMLAYYLFMNDIPKYSALYRFFRYDSSNHDYYINIDIIYRALRIIYHLTKREKNLPYISSIHKIYKELETIWTKITGGEDITLDYNIHYDMAKIEFELNNLGFKRVDTPLREEAITNDL